ncbi:hypothetical protein ACVR1G_06060 [Streptococcus dentasini]
MKQFTQTSVMITSLAGFAVGMVFGLWGEKIGFLFALVYILAVLLHKFISRKNRQNG